MKTRFIAKLLVGTLVCSGFIAVQAESASACTLTGNIPTSSGASDKVHYSGTGVNCDGVPGQHPELNVRLYHYYAPPITDALVNYVFDVTGSDTGGYSGNWSASGAQCDNGGSTTYYTQPNFYATKGSTQVGANSSRRTINHC